MKIPASIKIGGHDIKITRCKPNEISSHGEYYGRGLEIRLDDDYDLPESRQAECFLHETIEAIRHLYNLKFDHAELVIISEQLFAIIRNNGLRFDSPEKEAKP